MDLLFYLMISKKMLPTGTQCQIRINIIVIKIADLEGLVLLTYLDGPSKEVDFLGEKNRQLSTNKISLIQSPSRWR